MDSDSEVETPIEIEELAKSARIDILPAKSIDAYEKTYADYLQWKKLKKIGTKTNSLIILAYFKTLSANHKPSTLWSTHSKLKSVIQFKEEIDISKYAEVNSFLKAKYKNYKPKKSKVFTAEEMKKYLTEAPDYNFLATKVIFIFGVAGACRCDEIVHITVDDVQQQGNIILVKIPVSKTTVSRQFSISDEFCPLIHKYMKLRPPHAPTNRFFLNYQKGKCSIQVIGKNKISAMPKNIAEYLNLAEPKLYTGHSFRRTSATILAEAGADFLTIKNHAAWKSSSVAEGYIDNTMKNRIKVGNLIATSINLPQSTTPKMSNLEEPFNSPTKTNSTVPNEERAKPKNETMSKAPTNDDKLWPEYFPANISETPMHIDKENRKPSITSVQHTEKSTTHKMGKTFNLPTKINSKIVNNEQAKTTNETVSKTPTDDDELWHDDILQNCCETTFVDKEYNKTTSCMKSDKITNYYNNCTFNITYHKC